MGSKSQYLEQKVLNFLGGENFSALATVYLALYTVAPTATSAGTEATGSGYVRLAIAANTTNFPAASGGGPATMSNGVTFTMATATGDWSSGSNMVAFALLDASSGGDMLYFGSLTEAKPVLNGDTPSFAPGALTFSET